MSSLNILHLNECDALFVQQYICDYWCASSVRRRCCYRNSVRLSVCLSVTLVSYAQTVQVIEIRFALHNTPMLDNCCVTEYDVMMP